MTDTPLDSVPAWSPEQIARMKAAWITSAEQVVALSATTGGLRSIAEQLGSSEEEARRLVDSARAQLPAATRAELERPVDTSEYGLGVLPPKSRSDRQ